MKNPMVVCSFQPSGLQFLFEPIVKKLGYEYGANDSADVTELRTLAITMCVIAEEPS